MENNQLFFIIGVETIIPEVTVETVEPIVEEIENPPDDTEKTSPSSSTELVPTGKLICFNL